MALSEKRGPDIWDGENVVPLGAVIFVHPLIVVWLLIAALGWLGLKLAKKIRGKRDRGKEKPENE